MPRPSSGHCRCTLFSCVHGKGVYSEQKNIRLIRILCEVTSRLVFVTACRFLPALMSPLKLTARKAHHSPTCMHKPEQGHQRTPGSAMKGRMAEEACAHLSIQDGFEAFCHPQLRLASIALNRRAARRCKCRQIDQQNVKAFQLRLVAIVSLIASLVG